MVVVDSHYYTKIRALNVCKEPSFNVSFWSSHVYFIVNNPKIGFNQDDLIEEQIQIYPTQKLLQIVSFIS